MIDRVERAFDRPAITTDIIVGFPGETDDEFDRTVEVAQRAKFIHIHAFPFSPRPGTAAARWDEPFVTQRIATERITRLTELAAEHSFAFRQQFIGHTVQVLVERQGDTESTIRHGRCERYFDIHFEADDLRDGDHVRVRIDRVTPTRTHGVVVRHEAPVLQD
jgi:tRNA A37 methylthiotransferase MiaB